MTARLRERRSDQSVLIAVRVFWVALTAVIVGLIIVGVPVTWNFLLQPCSGGASCLGWGLTAAGISSVHRSGISLDVYVGFLIGNNLGQTILWLTVSAIIVWRAPLERMALLTPFVLLAFPASAAVGILATLAVVQPVWSGPIHVVQLAGVGLLIPFLYTFPDGRFVPRWTLWFCIAGMGAQIEQSLVYMGAWQRSPLSQFIALAVLAVSLASIPLLQVYRYRRIYDSLQRQQTKWVVVGVALAVVGLIVLIVGSSTSPNDFQALPIQQLIANVSWTVVTMFIPITIGIAVLRYRLWDVDVFINRALVYGSLTVTLGALYIGGVIVFQMLARSVTGQSSDLAIAIVTLTVAALFNPWRRALQAFIDRRFYRRKYDAARTLAAFTSRLRDEVDLDQLAGDLAGVVNDTVQPSSISLWLPRPREPA